jgi:tetratricopeptide (TPR) repeat protein
MLLRAGFTLALAGMLATPVLAASDWDVCRDDKAAAEASIAACTRIIKSGRYKGRDLAATYFNRAVSYRQQKNDDAALADYAAAIRVDPKYASAYNRRGNIHKDRGDPDRAIAEYNEAIRLNPDFALAYMNRGDAWDDKNERDKAIADLDRAIRIDPKNALAYNIRGVVWKKKGEYDRAIADFNSAIRIEPTSAAYHVNRGDALDDKGDQAAALRDLDEAIRLNPNSARAYTIRGVVNRKRGEHDRAIADYTSAIRVDPDYAVAYLNRGSIYKDRDELDRAIADFSAVMRINPKNDVAYLRRSEAYFKKRDMGAALRDADQAVSLDPKDAANYVNRASLRIENGDGDRAIADLNEAIRIRPSHAKALAMRGLAFEKQADRTRALADFIAVLGIQGADKWATETALERRAALENPVMSLTAPRPTFDLAGVSPGGPAKADIGRRVALVIGNSAYAAVAALPNPRRDAQSIAAALRQVGFQTVRLEADLSREKLIDALRTFAREAEYADWALVYFAGHGIEISGTNYLLPVDAKLETDRDVSFEAVPMEQVLNAVEGAKRMRLVLLDACRDNPFASRMRRTNTTRSVSRGLSRIEPDSGTLVVYAAKHGETASDGPGNNSPFAEAIVKNIGTPGLELRRMFDLVRDDVMESTNRRQQPFTYGSLPGRQDYFFVSR